MTLTPAHPPLRRAGRLALREGRELAWSMAEGSRGRRWRSNVLDADRLVEVLLLEVDLVGRPARLELSTPAGLLTLHPEPDESMIHGNVVRDDGVVPLAFAWSPEHELLVAGNLIPTLVALRHLGGSAGGGDRASIPALVVDAGLQVRIGALEIHRTAATSWAIGEAASPGAGTHLVSMSPEGLPMAERGSGELATEWPLEADQDPPP